MPAYQFWGLRANSVRARRRSLCSPGQAGWVSAREVERVGRIDDDLPGVGSRCLLAGSPTPPQSPELQAPGSRHARRSRRSCRFGSPNPSPRSQSTSLRVMRADHDIVPAVGKARPGRRHTVRPGDGTPRLVAICPGPRPGPADEPAARLPAGTPRTEGPATIPANSPARTFRTGPAGAACSSCARLQ
jgi:hypothetical protein